MSNFLQPTTSAPDLPVLLKPGQLSSAYAHLSPFIPCFSRLLPVWFPSSYALGFSLVSYISDMDRKTYFL